MNFGRLVVGNPSESCLILKITILNEVSDQRFLEVVQFVVVLGSFNLHASHDRLDLPLEVKIVLHHVVLTVFSTVVGLFFLLLVVEVMQFLRRVHASQDFLVFLLAGRTRNHVLVGGFEVDSCVDGYLKLVEGHVVLVADF